MQRAEFLQLPSIIVIVRQFQNSKTECLSEWLCNRFNEAYRVLLFLIGQEEAEGCSKAGCRSFRRSAGPRRTGKA